MQVDDARVVERRHHGHLLDDVSFDRRPLLGRLVGARYQLARAWSHGLGLLQNGLGGGG